MNEIDHDLINRGHMHIDAADAEYERQRHRGHASGEPAHISELREPVENQQIIDSASAVILRESASITDDEWRALVENARCGAEANKPGDWPETRQTLEAIGRMIGRVVE